MPNGGEYAIYYFCVIRRYSCGWLRRDVHQEEIKLE